MDRPIKITIAAYHPQSKSLLFSMQEFWKPEKATRGFYSKTMVKCVKKGAYLSAQFIENPLGVRKPAIRVFKQ